MLQKNDLVTLVDRSRLPKDVEDLILNGDSVVDFTDNNLVDLKIIRDSKEYILKGISSHRLKKLSKNITNIRLEGKRIHALVNGKPKTKKISELKRYVIEKCEDKKSYMLSLFGVCYENPEKIRDIRKKDITSLRNISIRYGNITVDVPNINYRPTNSYFGLLGIFCDPTILKNPSNTDLGNWLGIEIECFMPDYTRTDVSDLIKRHKIKNIMLADDGSLEASNEWYNSDDDVFLPIEFKVLTKINDMENLEKLLNVINREGALVNNSCGLHVHLDMRHSKNYLSVRHKANRLLKLLPMLKGMVPKNRWDNTYCNSDISTKGNRYACINTIAYQKHKTLEVRLHSGTTNFEKISQWCKILHRIANTKLPKNYIYNYNIKEAVNMLGLSPDTEDYIRSRTNRFHPDFIDREKRAMLPNIAPIALTDRRYEESEFNIYF